MSNNICPSWRTCKEIIEFLFKDFEEWFSLMSLTGSIYIWLSAKTLLFRHPKSSVWIFTLRQDKRPCSSFLWNNHQDWWLSKILNRFGNLVSILFNGFVKKKTHWHHEIMLEGMYILPLFSEDSASTLTQFPIELSCTFYSNIWSKNLNWNSQNYF